jgi:hypothetical protein
MTEPDTQFLKLPEVALDSYAEVESCLQTATFKPVGDVELCSSEKLVQSATDLLRHLPEEYRVLNLISIVDLSNSLSSPSSPQYESPPYISANLGRWYR